MYNAKKILVVDDEKKIVEALRAYLKKNEYIVFEAYDGKKALEVFDSVAPHLVILDLMLPDISGEEVCRTIRRKSWTPIIMLTAKTEEDDMLTGLNIGADDYVTKPSSPREILARVAAVLRRSQTDELIEEADQLVSANAVVNLVSSLSGMIDPVVGGILYGAFGLSPILTVSCVCFAISAIMELFIRIPHTKQQTSGSVLQIIKSDMSQSIHFMVIEKPILAKSIVVIFLFNIALSSMIIIGLPVLITQNLGMNSRLYGITQGVMAAGGLIGGILAGVLGKRLVIQKAHLLLLLCGISIIPMGLVFLLDTKDFTAYVVITATCFIAMAAATLFAIQILAFVQAQTPVEIVGKVMSCLIALSISAQPIGQVLFGLLFERFSALPWIVVFASAFMSCVIALYSRKQFGRI